LTLLPKNRKGLRTKCSGNSDSSTSSSLTSSLSIENNTNEQTEQLEETSVYMHNFRFKDRDQVSSFAFICQNFIWQLHTQIQYGRAIISNFTSKTNNLTFPFIFGWPSWKVNLGYFLFMKWLGQN
jgi:hypothetical protein